VTAVNDASDLTQCSGSYTLSGDGTVTPLPGAGLGVAVDEEFFCAPIRSLSAKHGDDRTKH
jgi:hypothetical protein